MSAPSKYHFLFQGANEGPSTNVSTSLCSHVLASLFLSCCSLAAFVYVDEAAKEIIWSHLEFEHSENRMNQMNPS